MKLISYSFAGKSSFGALIDGAVVDLPKRLNTTSQQQAFQDLRALLAADALGLARQALKGAGADYRVDEIAFEPVIRNPSKILCIGLNYEEHRIETARPPSRHPTVFTRFADTQVGHLGNIIKPRHSDKVDYEAELALIIGQAGRDIPEARARDHVAGYACYNDVSIRDFQGHTSQFTPGKNFPGTGAFGPALVTADEVGEIGTQRIQSRLNGTIMQDSRLGNMIFPIERLIAYISQWTPLSPGDVIVTGTPGGVGMKRVPPVYMKDGDEIIVEIDGVGLLQNRVSAEK
jgi:2-keto-4-pentenoate hydratase/2-oxohepta-3-ene-1,7-dioic acid hydratase in catechol pathway